MFVNLSLWLVIFFGALLRLYNLGRYSLWKDEIFSTLEAQQTIIDIFTKKSYFLGYTPVHHFFTHLALYFGKDEFIVRFPSVVFGVATIFLIYKLGELLFGKKVGLVAAFLLSISPFHLEYSREVRYYPYLIFFSGLTLYFLYKFLLEKKKRWLIAFSLATVLNIMTQPTALLVLIAEVTFLIAWGIKNFGRIVVTGKAQKSKFQNILFVVIMIVLAGLTSIFIKSFNELFTSIKLKPAMPPLDFLNYIFTNLSGEKVILFLSVIFFIFGLLAVFKSKKEIFTPLFLILILPPLVLYFVRPQVFDFHIRYVSFIIIPYLIFASMGVLNLLKTKLLLALGLLVFTSFYIQPIQAYYHTKKGDWRGVGQYLAVDIQPGDVVITENSSNKILLDYYLEAQKQGIVLKTAVESLIPIKIPFRVFFHQHDNSLRAKANPEGLPLVDYEKIIPFDPDAAISPMYLFVSRPIWFWQEGEIGFFEGKGWGVSDFWGQKIIATDALASPEAAVSYKISIPVDGNYDLYANLRWDGARGLLKYKINSERWSEGFQPFYGEKGDVVRQLKWKEKNLGTHYLKAGEHIITFVNQKAPDGIGRYQDIDYFYLTKYGE